MDIAVPVDHRVKIKESEMIDKYLDLSREQKIKTKLLNVRGMVIPIIAGALETDTKVVFFLKVWSSWKTEDGSRPSTP